MEKNENKEQDNTQHETPCSKATQNKNYTRTTALERSVAKTTGGFKAPLLSTYLYPGSDVILNIKLQKAIRYA